MAKNKSTSANKESRLSIRVDPERKAVIARAAKQHGYTISDFVLENAYQMATELLADERKIVLTKKQVAHIFEVLDRPPPRVSRPFASCLPSGRSWMAESEFTSVAPLVEGHDRIPFDCGVPALNQYLRNSCSCMPRTKPRPTFTVSTGSSRWWLTY